MGVPDGHVAISYQAARLMLDALMALDYHEEHGSDALGDWADGTLTALIVEIAGQLPEKERPGGLRLASCKRFQALRGDETP